MHSLKRLSLTVNQVCKCYLRRSLSSKPVKDEEVEVPKERNILVEHIDSVTTIGINRPAKKNCINNATAEELSEELDKFENDENSTVGVLYGVGGNFCSGYDLSEIAQYDGENESTAPQFGSLANRIDLCKKPLIAGLSGHAVGVGFELALMCDMRIIEESAVLGFLNRRFGIPILCGGTVRLPALIGYARAMELILTGRAISAQDAFNWGLANRCVPCGAGLGQALAFAKSLVKFPQNVLLADRASAHFATFSAKQIEEAMQFEKDNSSHLLFETGVEGAKRFMTEGLGRHGKFHHITTLDTSIKELDKDLL